MDAHLFDSADSAVPIAPPDPPDPAVPAAPATPPATTLVHAPVDPSPRRSAIEALVRADQTPLQVAAEFGLSLPEVLSLVDDPLLCLWVRQTCAINLKQTQVLLSRFGISAAVTLLQLAGKEQPDSPPEVARKSCVDLLEQVRAVMGVAKTPLTASPTDARLSNAMQTNDATASWNGRTKAAGDAAMSPKAPSEEAILCALELLDQQHEQDPSSPWPPAGSDSPKGAENEQARRCVADGVVRHAPDSSITPV